MSYFEFLKSFSLPFYIILGVTAVFFLWGAVTLLMAKGDQFKIAKGNKILLFTIIGFVGASFIFLIFTIGGKIITDRSQSSKNTVIINTEGFPPAPPQDPMPTIGE
jgi:hypothetical protein